MTYAKDTEVPVDRTRAEIERTLQRYGADQFAYGWDAQRAVIQFRAQDRQVRFVLTMPAPTERAFTHTKTNMRRAEHTAKQEWEKACRARWRALALVIKAKLEAIEIGISEFEHEFLANIVLPDGSTVGTWVAPQLVDVYARHEMPSALPALGPATS